MLGGSDSARASWFASWQNGLHCHNAQQSARVESLTPELRFSVVADQGHCGNGARAEKPVDWRPLPSLKLRRTGRSLGVGGTGVSGVTGAEKPASQRSVRRRPRFATIVEITRAPRRFVDGARITEAADGFD